jgi:hypothetical protein
MILMPDDLRVRLPKVQVAQFFEMPLDRGGLQLYLKLKKANKPIQQVSAIYEVNS